MRTPELRLPGPGASRPCGALRGAVPLLVAVLHLLGCAEERCPSSSPSSDTGSPLADSGSGTDSGADSGSSGGAADAGDGTCAARADCPGAALCVVAACGAAGQCVAPSAPCPQDWQPVCGCDGQTWSTRCRAERAGVGVESEGPCEPPSQGCSLRGKGCASEAYCRVAGCGARGPGTCVAKAAPCESDASPVCGCDDKTWPDACAAQQAGINVASEGACTPSSSGGGSSGGGSSGGGSSSGGSSGGGDTGVGQACGGVVGVLCKAGLFCDPASCDPGAAGTCQNKPGLCGLPPPGAEVCGCDGKTYAGECQRRSAGVGKAKEGPCG